MDYLVEIYDTSGRKFDSWRSPDPMTALSELAAKVVRWNGLGFANASCYYHSVQQWNLEIN